MLHLQFDHIFKYMELTWNKQGRNEFMFSIHFGDEQVCYKNIKLQTHYDWHYDQYVKSTSIFLERGSDAHATFQYQSVRFSQCPLSKGIHLSWLHSYWPAVLNSNHQINKQIASVCVIGFYAWQNSVWSTEASVSERLLHATQCSLHLQLLKALDWNNENIVCFF